MWRAFTREKAARPGLAICIMACAFAGTMSLATLLTRQRDMPLQVRHDAFLGNWPIEFGLPGGYQLHVPESRIGSDSDGAEWGVAVFKYGAGGDPTKTVKMQYRFFQPASELLDVMHEMVEPDVVDYDPMEIGGNRGGMFQRIRWASHELIAVAVREDGLAVSVTCRFGNIRPGTISSGDQAHFGRICESIVFKDGMEGRAGVGR